VESKEGFKVVDPLFRGSGADLNMTLAMALVFFACWTVWALQANGFKGFFLHIFGPKGDTAGALKMLMIVIFLMAGLLEVVSILFRPVSLSFRLYGNVFAGENMLETMIGFGSRCCQLDHSAAILFSGSDCGSRSGFGFHAVNVGIHAAHLPA
jgi:F-type H+-transporting ATPase subunit a